MSRFNRRTSANKIKWIITFVLLSILSVSMIFAFVKIDKNEKTKTLGTSVFTYSIGLLDEQGEYEQGTTSIYLKDYTSVDGLTIEVQDKATITYSLFLYDENKDLVEIKADLSSNFDGSELSDSVKYFRVMITPTNDAEVSLFEVGTYAGQLTITVNK